MQVGEEELYVYGMITRTRPSPLVVVDGGQTESIRLAVHTHITSILMISPSHSCRL